MSVDLSKLTPGTILVLGGTWTGYQVRLVELKGKRAIVDWTTKRGETKRASINVKSIVGTQGEITPQELESGAGE